MSCKNSEVLRILRGILRQRMQVERLGKGRKNNGTRLAATAGDYLEHIKMFTSEGQAIFFIKKNWPTIEEICVSTSKKKSLSKLNELVYA